MDVLFTILMRVAFHIGIWAVVTLASPATQNPDKIVPPVVIEQQVETESVSQQPDRPTSSLDPSVEGN